MSIGSVSPTLAPYAQGSLADAFKQRRQDFGSLASALGSGNLQGAQQAFAALQQDMQTIAQARSAQGSGDADGDNDGSSAAQGTTGQTASTSSFQSLLAQRTQDLNALSTALGAGDLQSAQQAFAALQQDMQALGQGRHRHHHGAAAASAATPTVSTPATGSTAPVSSPTINVTA